MSNVDCVGLQVGKVNVSVWATVTVMFVWDNSCWATCSIRNYILNHGIVLVPHVPVFASILS